MAKTLEKNFKKATILVVDDEPLNRKVFVGQLEHDNYHVICAQSGQEALDVLSKDHEQIDLVVLDRMMPGMDGIEVINNINDKLHLKHLPVIMVSAAISQEDIAQGIEAGVFYYITKPYETKTLLAVVDRAVKAVQQEEAAEEASNKLQEEMTLVELLQRIAIAANEAFSVEEAMHICLSHICNYMKWPIGHMYLCDQENNSLYSSNIWYLEHPSRYTSFKKVTEESKFTSGQGLPGRVLRTKKIDWLNNFEGSYFRRGKQAKKCKLQSAFAFPVVTQDTIWAVLEFFAEEEQNPDQELLNFMTSIGAQIGRVFERRKAEETLQMYIQELKETTVSKEYIDNVVAAMPNMVMVVDDKLCIKRANIAVKHCLDFNEKDLLGKHFGSILKRKGDNIQMLIGSSETHNITTQYYTKKGKAVPVLFSWSAILDNDNHQHSVICVAQDITDVKNAEHARKEAISQLHQLQKMETIGTLAGGIAHDFNNILVPILGLTELMIETSEKKSPNYDNLKRVLDAANRAKSLVQQILAFSHHVDQKLEAVDVKKVLTEVVKFIEKTLSTSIKITKRADAKCGCVLADSTQIQQIIMNLCTNAAHSMGEKGGKLAISLKPFKADASFIATHPNMKKGNYICLEIKDTGVGMEKKTMKRIFDPFYTTKTVGEGTGLGLSVVHGIVKNYGGDIDVSSVIGKGTTFHVYLPEAKKSIHEAKSGKKTTLKGKERVLLVDDEEMVADVGKQTLEILGYDVTACTDAKEALELFKQQPNTFDILITDQTMPVMTGTELIAKIKEIRKIPVILNTGFSDVLSQEDREKAGIDQVMMKPVVAREISETIRLIIDGGKDDRRKK